MLNILHHGGTTGVTGSCHQLVVDPYVSVMVDCGLFQGNDAVRQGGTEIVDGEYLHFNLKVLPPLEALILTHAHIDHVGRLPYLLAAGFSGPILCSLPTARLLPLVIEDALKIGFTQNRSLIDKFLKRVNSLVIPLPYKKWYDVHELLRVKLQRAGHILGSSYVEIDAGGRENKKRVVFSGDLGPPYTPLLKTPASPYRADWLILESTYGDREHEKRAQRKKLLEESIRKAISDGGTVLIPAFSLGRTQELLYELNSIFSQLQNKGLSEHLKNLDVIVDSPLSSRFTEIYKEMESFWDDEARRRLRYGDHPLVFRQLRTIDNIRAHISTVDERIKSSRPALVIAASGMCNGGRIMNYLEALISNPLTDILFTGYQADGTPGRIIQKYGPQKGYVFIDGKKYDIRAKVTTLSGYSAHADRSDLVNFVKRIRNKPERIILTHGERKGREGLASALFPLGYNKKNRDDEVTELEGVS